MEEIASRGRIWVFPQDEDPSALADLLARGLKEKDNLRAAWEQLAALDQTAKRDQTAFRRQQWWILGLGVGATALALTQASLERNGFLTNRTWLAEPLRWAIVLVPIVVAVLVAAAARFRPGSRWVVLRGSAESIKREIFRYRAQVGAYSDARTTTTPAKPSSPRRLAPPWRR
jgi:hypothetical protein